MEYDNQIANLEKLQELCREKNIKTTGRKKELKARPEEHQTKGKVNASQARPGPSGNADAKEHATPPKLVEASVRGKKSSFNSKTSMKQLYSSSKICYIYD